MILQMALLSSRKFPAPGPDAWISLWIS